MKINVNNLAIKYQNHYGIRNINVVLREGRFLALIGHNGSGKSSFCNALTGLLRPSEGSIEIHGLPEHQQDFSAIGFAPQTQVMDWYTNVETNVILGAQLAHLQGDKIQEQLNLVLDLLDLTSLRNRKLTELSGGQLQRVQIARALIHQPLIYILDEPTVGLDAQNTDNLMRYLKQEANQGKLVIVSSHDLFLLQEYAEEVLLLDDGRLIYHGLMDDLIKAKEKTRKFVFTFEQIYSSFEDFLGEGIGIISANRQSDNVWQLEVDQSMTINHLMLLLKEDVQVINLIEHEKTLKEVYLSMSKRSGVVATD